MGEAGPSCATPLLCTQGGRGPSAHRDAHLGYGAQQHRIPIPALEQDLGHLRTLLLPGACRTIPPQHLQPPSRTSGPRDTGTPTARCARTHSLAPSPPPAISGQLLKPQVPGNSLQPYKQQQARQQQRFPVTQRNTTAPRTPGPANSHGSQNLAHAFGLHTKGMQSSLLAASLSRPV